MKNPNQVKEFHFDYFEKFFLEFDRYEEGLVFPCKDQAGNEALLKIYRGGGQPGKDAELINFSEKNKVEVRKIDRIVLPVTFQ